MVLTFDLLEKCSVCTVAILILIVHPFVYQVLLINCLQERARHVSPHFNLMNLFSFISRGGSFTADHPDSSRPPTASSSRSDLLYSGRQQKSWNFEGYSSDNDVMWCFWCFISIFPLRPLHNQIPFLIVSNLDGGQLWPSGVSWARRESAVEPRASGEW